MYSLFLMVTVDKYELPLCVCDTIDELASIAHVSPNAIYSAISHYKRGDRKTCKYRIVNYKKGDAEYDA